MDLYPNKVKYKEQPYMVACSLLQDPNSNLAVTTYYGSIIENKLWAAINMRVRDW